MRARWSPRALTQLREAREYIAKEDKRAARMFVESIILLAQRLAEYPGMGLPTDEEDVIVFPLVRYRYLVFYRILSDAEIRIVRIRHTSQER